MTNLQKLHEKFDQSPWLDNLSRDLLDSGKLQSYIDQGVRGLTSNPTILENAITHSTAYDGQIKTLALQGLSTEEIYWKLVEDDIRAAADMLRPVYDESDGEDGFVSLEVSPTLAADTVETIAQAKRLWAEVNRPNLMIKIPATDACIPAIKALLAEGMNINVTLIFSLDHYSRVVDAHRATHGALSGNIARSVASFFISRVDTEVDKRLEAIGTQDALNLRGQAAVAQAHLAYEIFEQNFGDLEPHSPAIQRLLWASTSAKNPAYEDLIYVRYLAAPATVNTMPEATLDMVNDHLAEDTRAILPIDIEHAHDVLNRIAAVGVDMDDVTAVLEAEGVQKFQNSFGSLLAAINTKK